MSKLEQMAYKMMPAGHERPAPKRTYSKPDNKLVQVFEGWLNNLQPDWMSGKRYESAEIAVREIQPSLEEINALVLAYQDDPRAAKAGYFISALHNKVPEKEIVSNVGSDVMKVIGYRLQAGKTLVNLNKVDMLGEHSRGTVINYGEARDTVGYQGSHGLGINYGLTRTFAGFALCAVHINFGTVAYDREHNDTASIFINFGKWGKSMPRFTYLIVSDFQNKRIYDSTSHNIRTLRPLNNYLDNLQALLAPGKEDYQKAIKAVKTLGENPGNKISEDIIKILKEAGHRV